MVLRAGVAQSDRQDPRDFRNGNTIPAREVGKRASNWVIGAEAVATEALRAVLEVAGLYRASVDVSNPFL